MVVVEVKVDCLLTLEFVKQFLKEECLLYFALVEQTSDKSILLANFNEVKSELISLAL